MTEFFAPQISSGRRVPERSRLGHFARAPAPPRADPVLWHERARQRRHLQFLSDHMLRDIGLIRADVLAEADKPFWGG